MRSDGEEFPIETTISQVEAEGQKLYTVILRDVTLRRQAEEALVQSEKLASAGRLAATIAHEINNPLAAVTNLLYLARSEPHLSEAARQHLELADTELQRVAHITKQTLGFYRDESAPSHFDPAELLDDVLALLDTRDRKPAKFRGRHALPLSSPGAGLARRDSPGFFQRHQQRHRSPRSPADAFASRSPAPAIGAARQRGVRVTIADAGHGIAPENLARIFEPFFTTKKDAGTGLGLWVCRQIVDKHSGSIRVRSRRTPQSSGTVFSIFLPVADAAEHQKRAVNFS